MTTLDARALLFPPAKLVDLIRHQSQVRWINTSTVHAGDTTGAGWIGVMAKVIPLQSLWRFSYKEVMGEPHGFASHGAEHSIASVVQRVQPNHAAIGTARINLGPETSLRSAVYSKWSKAFGGAVAQFAQAVLFAKTTVVNKTVAIIEGADRLSAHREFTPCVVMGSDVQASRPLYCTSRRRYLA